jgi:Bacteriophage HK97-gp10, putative tail-component
MDIADLAEKTTRVEVGTDPRDQPRTGAMARSWRVEVQTFGGGFAYIVRNRKPYAKFVDEGTAGPYRLAARKTRYLRFKDRNGNWRTVKEVTHPGIQRPYHILRRSTRTILTRRLR